MPEFHETRMGRKFYESDVPRIADALDKIARIASSIDEAGAIAGIAAAARAGESVIVEQVWIITDLERHSEPPVVKANGQSARMLIRELLEERSIIKLWLKKLEAWNGTDDVVLGPYRIQCADVSL